MHDVIQSWAAAAQETFLTWGLLGACIMQLQSHKNLKSKTNTMLQKESACIVAFTFAVLLLGSFLANTCVQILKNYGYAYIPGSFGEYDLLKFLYNKYDIIITVFHLGIKTTTLATAVLPFR